MPATGQKQKPLLAVELWVGLLAAQPEVRFLEQSSEAGKAPAVALPLAAASEQSEEAYDRAVVVRTASDITMMNACADGGK